VTTIFDTISDIIQARYEEQGYGVPYAIDNGPWTPLATPAEHHLLSLAWEEVVEAGFGGNTRGIYAIEGLGIVGIKVPIEEGWAGAMTRATLIADAFQFQQVGILEFMESAIVRIGRQGSYYRYNVHNPFRVFEQQRSQQIGTEQGLDSATSIDPKTALDRINGRFDTAIATPQSLTTGYDNMRLDTQPGAGDTWCSFSARHAEGAGEVGARRFTIPGLAVATIRVPLKTGTDAAYKLAGDIVTAFRGVSYYGINFTTPSLARIGRTGPSHSLEWWHLNVRCPYWFEYSAA
jgi:hypothetical protein